jgi:hypothetical protein
MKGLKVKSKVWQQNNLMPEESQPSPGVVHSSVHIPGSHGIRRGAGPARLVIAFVGLLLLSLQVQAATYTVKSGGGGNFATIQGCASAAVAGDTCTVYAGTYNEVVTLSHSGTGSGATCTNCITFQVNAGDTVNVYGFKVSANYVIINGFTITDPTLSHATAGVYFTGASTGVQILNNTITQVGAAGYPCISLRSSTPSHYVLITGNTVSWCASVPGQTNATPGAGIGLAADHTLAGNNDLSHVPNGMSVGFSNAIIIGNNYHDTNDTADFPGCHEAGGCDTHLDFFETGSSTAAVVIEGNQQSNVAGVGGTHAFNFTAAGTRIIFRFNTLFNTGSIGGVQGGTTNVHIYNNTGSIMNQIDTSNAVMAWLATGSTGGVFFNNIMYNAINPPGTVGVYYSVDGTSLPGFRSGYNLAYDNACSPETAAHCTSGLMLTDTGNIYADPKFVNPTGDFRLQSGSPAIGAGSALTTVAAGDSGSGTSLIVTDAGFFQDGYGIPGVNADCIAVTTVTNHVCITAVNYQTNTLTLSSSITRSAADRVWLYSDATGGQVLFGTGPNIGANFALGSRPAPPTNLTATPR